MKVIVFQNDPPPGWSIRIPAYGDTARPADMTDQDMVDREIARLPAGTVYHVVDTDDVGAFPPDRYFRNAWEWED